MNSSSDCALRLDLQPSRLRPALLAALLVLALVAVLLSGLDRLAGLSAWVGAAIWLAVELRRPRPQMLRLLGGDAVVIGWPDGREQAATLARARRLGRGAVLELRSDAGIRRFDLWPDQLNAADRKRLWRRLSAATAGASV